MTFVFLFSIRKYLVYACVCFKANKALELEVCFNE